MKNPNFDLATFSKINVDRCDDPTTFNCGNQGNVYWATAIAEEAGEVAGVIKKLARGFNPREFKKTQARVAVSPTNAEYNSELKEKFAAATWEDASYREMVRREWQKELTKKLGKELADLFTYIDLCATKNDINLWDEVKEKFNQVSKEMKCEQYIIE